jgi:hypothetical protein
VLVLTPLPPTSLEHYITGRAALNVPDADGSFADWHFSETFLSGRGKIRVAGKNAPATTDLLGSYGIRECSDVLRRFGAGVQLGEKIYVASPIRALLDMVLASLAKHRMPEHVRIDDMLDSAADQEEFWSQVQALKLKLAGKDTLSLLNQWELRLRV